VAVAKYANRRRLFIEDARRNGLYLRTTWHPEARQFVISTWNDDVCTGAVRVPVAEVAQLIGLLADGLADVAAVPPQAPDASRRRRMSLLDRMWAWLCGRKRVENVPPSAVVTLRTLKSAEPPIGAVRARRAHGTLGA
jgi:hypothetical protein